MRDSFRKDLYRWYGGRKRSLKERLFMPPELKYLKYFRGAQETKAYSPAGIWNRIGLHRWTAKTQIQIPTDAKIGAGFYIGHTGRIVINGGAVIGKNVNIAAGVTIGQENRGSRKGTPTIGDRCWIGSNAVVVGRVTVGTDVLIAPLAFVNFDVPDHAIVIGNPGRIILREGATDGYLSRLVED